MLNTNTLGTSVVLNPWVSWNWVLDWVGLLAYINSCWFGTPRRLKRDIHKWWSTSVAYMAFLSQPDSRPFFICCSNSFRTPAWNKSLSLLPIYQMPQLNLKLRRHQELTVWGNWHKRMDTKAWRDQLSLIRIYCSYLDMTCNQEARYFMWTWGEEMFIPETHRCTCKFNFLQTFLLYVWKEKAQVFS